MIVGAANLYESLQAPGSQCRLQGIDCMLPRIIAGCKTAMGHRC